MQFNLFVKLKVNHVVKLRHRFYKRDAGQLLTSFCSYQALYHEKFKNGPDHSVLITGDDLCLGDDKDFRSCQTVGLANIGSMCREHSSCTVAQVKNLNIMLQKFSRGFRLYSLFHLVSEFKCTSKS